MDMQTVLTLPRLGETMEQARVTDWLKAPGDAFRRGDVLLEVETDKTVVEVPALQDGVLLTHLVAAGDMVDLHQPIAEVRVAAGEGAPAPAAPRVAIAPMAPNPAPDAVRADARPAASPRARALARQAGVDLAGLAGSGRRGRITGADVVAGGDGVQQVATPQGPLALRRVTPVKATGAPILLLHGLFDDGRGWRDLPQRLARAGHPVLVPDLPGHGASEARADDLDSATAALAALLDRVAPDGPLRLVGHSLGAVLATRLAVLLGNRVERLVLLSPAGLGPRLNPDFLDLMAAAETPAALARALSLLGAVPLSGAALATELATLRKRRAATAPLARLLAVAGIQQTDIAPQLDTLACPLVALFGLNDRIVNWQDCASLPARTAIHLLRDAGHQPHTSAADLVARLIIQGPPTPQP
ncbi:alpha/beta fold hydrolase [Paracoccaceae bacterium Fryx2]|nr:alpha/beta fold hydrolase [Paracoccaceae bacterium Fryx2]